MTESVTLDHITMVLVRPRYPENIGAAARAARNMGIGGLSVVDPENFDLTKVMKLATHAAAETVERIGVFDNLESALASHHYVVGTTARLGGQRQAVQSPDRLARQLISISKQNRIAVLFGPEDRGLTNEDLRFCHSLVNIPTAEFSSLNLAQAVMVMSYELFTAGDDSGIPFVPRMATRYELDGMYDQLKDVLVRISFINPENPDYWMNNMRHFFNRLKLRAKEVSIIRGICRQIDWYGRKCHEDGRLAGRAEVQAALRDNPVDD